mmetsp:Transcript_95239/g.307440  ORF Transcript_95239/g.307440 Transcript_95239/m.307440 type:complete len:164 (-) Transcript_95239:261-752(-)
MAVKGADIIDEFIDKGLLECLNENQAHPVANAFNTNDDFLESDADHQLIVKVQFRQPIKLAGIKIKVDAEEESHPTLLKVYQGKNDMGFDEASSDEPTEQFALEPDQLEHDLAVRFVKYQYVQSLQLFIEENHGGPATRIQRISFTGMPASNMDMKDWKPCKS